MPDVPDVPDLASVAETVTTAQAEAEAAAAQAAPAVVPEATQPEVPTAPAVVPEQGAPVAAGDGTPVPENERVIPPTAESVTHDAAGNATREGGVPQYIYVKAHHNLPAWNLWAVETEEVVDPDSGEVVEAAHPTEGFIPNNEEGVNAVTIGFASLAEPPEGVEPPA